MKESEQRFLNYRVAATSRYFGQTKHPSNVGLYPPVLVFPLMLLKGVVFI